MAAIHKDVIDKLDQEWRDGDGDSYGRVDSGLGLEYQSMSSEDRSSTESNSLSRENRHQVCGENKTGLEQRTGKLTLSDEKSVVEENESQSVKDESGYFSLSCSGYSTERTFNKSASRPSFLNSFARTGDIRYLFASFSKFLFTQNQDGDTCLHLAIINGQEQVFNGIVDVLREKRCLDLYNDLTQTPLHLAVITMQPRVINKLINSGASVELPDRNGQTCVHLACQRGDLNSLQAIFQPRRYKPEIKEKLQEILQTRNFEGMTPLHIAVSKNKPKVVKELIALGADANLADGKSGHTALHLAVEQNSLPIISCLLFDGYADPNALSYSGCTPLHLAAGLGLRPVVAVLIAAGGDPRVENSEGDTVIEIASENVEDIWDTDCDMEI